MCETPALDTPCLVLSVRNRSNTVRARHPKKSVEAALGRAEDQGFRVETNRGHWGIVYCPGKKTGKCPPFSVNGSPRIAENEARRIDRFLARCPHKKP
jgi:hypothetical protein